MISPPARLPVHRILQRFLLLPVLLGVLHVLLLSSCDGEHNPEGVDWEIPDEDSMPAGFTEEDQQPFFTRYWRMPEGFRGFTARWNRQAKAYVRAQIRNNSSQMAHILVKMRLRWISAEERAALRVRLQESYVKLQSLRQRAEAGDYLVFRREDELPEDLQWEDGGNQPELGSPQATKGGTMRLALQRSFPNSLSPFGPNSNNSTRRYLYDDVDIPLVRFHPLTGKLIPGTADRWAISEDGRTVYFHLDEKARFSNGAPLTTRDFVTSLYVRTSEYSLEPFYRDFYLDNFSRITIYGNHTLAVTLPHARPYAPYFATIPACCTAFYAEFGPDFATRYQWRAAPTTGGYRLARHFGIVKGRQLVMERVRDWWAADRKYTRYSCNVDTIVYTFISEATKARELFRVGELDVYTSREPDFWYEGLEIEPVHRGYIQRVHFNNIWPRNCFGVFLNSSHRKMQNYNFRKGLHYALNMQSVINTVYRGDYSRSGSFFAGFGKYTDESIRALPYSPEKAREYFARAGYTEEGGDGYLYNAKGERLCVVISSRVDPLYATCMGLLREDAARCGLDLRYDPMDDTVFYRKVKDKQVQASLFSWSFSPPMPNPAPCFLSDYAYAEDGNPVRGSANITATRSALLDQAILSTRYAASEQEAVTAHHRVQQLIAKTKCWIPGWHSNFVRLAQWRWVRWPDEPDCRFCPPRYYDPLDSHLYWIDEKMKRETLSARSRGESFPEVVIDVPLPDLHPSHTTEPSPLLPLKGSLGSDAPTSHLAQP